MCELLEASLKHDSGMVTSDVDELLGRFTEDRFFIF